MHLSLVLDKLREYKYYAKLKKCAFWLSKVAFQGHVINQHGITVDPKNVAFVVDWQRPTTWSCGILSSVCAGFSHYCKADDEANNEGCSICLD